MNTITVVEQDCLLRLAQVVFAAVDASDDAHGCRTQEAVQLVQAANHLLELRAGWPKVLAA